MVPADRCRNFFLIFQADEESGLKQKCMMKTCFRLLVCIAGYMLIGAWTQQTVTEDQVPVCYKSDVSSKRHGLKLKVASYNIRYASKDDITTGNGWNTRKESVARLIRKHAFDIIGTQEGDPQQMKELMALLPDYDYISHPYGGTSGALHTASIIYKKKEFSIVDQGVFWFSETPNVESIGWDATDTRICKWARIKHRSTGQQFYFFTSHLYWRYETARRNSGAVLVAEIKKIIRDSLHVISTGDFNSTPDSPQVLDMLTEFKDAFQFTQTAPQGSVNTALPGGVFEGTPHSRIDYVMVSQRVQVLSYKVISDRDKKGNFPSDHLPVVCELLLE